MKKVKKYNVYLELDVSDEIKEMNCNCRGFEKSHNYKHVYALLYSLKYSNNKSYIINNLEKEILPSVRLMLKKFEEYCKKKTNFEIAYKTDAVIKPLNDIIKIMEAATQELKGVQTEKFALNRLLIIYNNIFDI